MIRINGCDSIKSDEQFGKNKLVSLRNCVFIWLVLVVDELNATDTHTSTHEKPEDTVISDHTL